MKYGRIKNGIVLETFRTPEGFTLQECFTPDVAAQFLPIPEHVEQDFVHQGGDNFVAPVYVPPPIITSDETAKP